MSRRMSSHVDYQRFRHGEGCTEEGCRARKFYIEDGKKFCQRGHEQAGFTQTQQDEDDWNAQGKKSRKKREEKERVETVLSGSQARELYFQCYQLILWKQIHWLVTLKGFAPELETIVRDLWSLRLGILHKERDKRSGYGSGTGTMMFSSTGESDNTDTDGSGFKSLGSRSSRRSVKVQGEKLPKLIETLGLCYLGMILLKLPTSLGEIVKWATREEIVYARAIKEVPKEMRSKLPSAFHSALEIRAPLKGVTLHRTVLELVEFYHLQYEMVFPSLNTPLLLYKYMTSLGLPVEIYPAVRRLADLLEVDFSWPILLKRAPSVVAYPEVRLTSLVVIATKLSHPFDNIARIPESDNDPTTVKIDWTKWRETMTNSPLKGLKRGEEITMTDMDVMNMNGKKMDDYLDWYQRTWIDDRAPKIAEQILELFPLQEAAPLPAEDSDSEERSYRFKRVHENLVLQKPRPVQENEAGLVRPGELYRRYRTVEELPDNAKAFYELAAASGGISLKMLVRGVFQAEVEIEKWILADRRSRLVEEQRRSEVDE